MPLFFSQASPHCGKVVASTAPQCSGMRLLPPPDPGSLVLGAGTAPEECRPAHHHLFPCASYTQQITNNPHRTLGFQLMNPALLKKIRLNLSKWRLASHALCSNHGTSSCRRRGHHYPPNRTELQHPRPLYRALPRYLLG